MTGPKTPSRDRPKTKQRPQSERGPSTADTPTGDHIPRSTDEGSEGATQRDERGFDPNVNQRPPR
jgi:hypothetical protein